MDPEPLHRELIAFLKAVFAYSVRRVTAAGANFEEIKNLAVDVLLARRGAHTSFFVHGSIITLALVVLVGGGVITSGAVVSGSYPGVPTSPLVAGASSDLSQVGVISSVVTPVTVISEKPRDKTVEYEVKEGETVSSIAEQFGVSEQTILWENDLAETAPIKAGQKLKILPVSGVAYEVESGDTIYSIAKKFRASAQAIIDFPFNDIGDDFGLASGQLLIVPDGAPPEKPKRGWWRRG